MKKHRLLLGQLILLAALLAGGLGVYKYMSAPIRAPQMQYRLINNSLISTTDLQGKVAAINFWSTDCVPCVKEMPMLAQVYHDYQSQGFDLLAVALNIDEAKKVVQFARVNALPFKVAYDVSGEAQKSWGPLSIIPTTFILDRKGRVVEVIDQELTYEQLSSIIQKYL